jgi:hypothetical protein
MRTLTWTGLAGLIALAPSMSRAQPTLPTWTLREEMRLDAEEHDFPSIGSVIVGPGGRIALTIPQDRQIRVYSATGAEQYRFGRRGSGPGEFEQPLTMRFMGDSVWMYDLTHRRVTIITPEGKLARTMLMASQGGLPSMNPMFIRGESVTGTAVVRSSDGAAGASTIWLARILREDSPQQLVPLPTTTVTVNAAVEGRTMGRVVPFTAQASWSFSGSGTLLSWINTVPGRGSSADVHVIAYRIDGTKRFERRIPFQALPVTAAQRDSALATITRQDAALGPELERKARPLVPSVQPVHRGLVQGEDGSVWIRTRSTHSPDATMVLNGQGEPTAWVTLPPRTSIRAADATHVWASEADEDGLVSVVRFRIVR